MVRARIVSGWTGWPAAVGALAPACPYFTIRRPLSRRPAFPANPGDWAVNGGSGTRFSSRGMDRGVIEAAIEREDIAGVYFSGSPAARRALRSASSASSTSFAAASCSRASFAFLSASMAFSTAHCSAIDVAATVMPFRVRERGVAAHVVRGHQVEELLVRHPAVRNRASQGFLAEESSHVDLRPFDVDAIHGTAVANRRFEHLQDCRAPQAPAGCVRAIQAGRQPPPAGRRWGSGWWAGFDSNSPRWRLGGGVRAT